MSGLFNGLVASHEDCDYFSKDYFEINNCGFLQDRSGKGDIHSSVRKDYKLIYQWSGGMRYSVNDRIYDLNPGSIIIHKPNDVCRIIKYTGNSLHYWIHFSGGVVNEILEDNGLCENDYRNIGLSATVCDLFYKIIINLKKDDFNKKTITNAYFMQILATVASISAGGEQTIDDDRKLTGVLPAIRYIHENYDENHHNSYYAKLCGLSESRFYYTFSNLLNMTPQTYLESLRIEAARNLLITTDISIKEVAEQVGYEDQLYFSRVFKKNIGVSPLNYRKIYLSNNTLQAEKT